VLATRSGSPEIHLGVLAGYALFGPATVPKCWLEVQLLTDNRIRATKGPEVSPNGTIDTPTDRLVRVSEWLGRAWQEKG
jgi:hypothetical protein